MYLNELEKDKINIINKININTKNKRRLYDIGLNIGTKIKMLFISPSKNIKAYLIRDSVIAIRDIDASKIEVI